MIVIERTEEDLRDSEEEAEGRLRQDHVAVRDQARRFEFGLGHLLLHGQDRHQNQQHPLPRIVPH